MVTDGNAANADEEHNAALIAFYDCRQFIAAKGKAVARSCAAGQLRSRRDERMFLTY